MFSTALLSLTNVPWLTVSNMPALIVAGKLKGLPKYGAAPMSAALDSSAASARAALMVSSQAISEAGNVKGQDRKNKTVTPAVVSPRLKEKRDKKSPPFHACYA
jgi:hypothetical protein